MVAPLLQAHVDINAPVAKVWELFPIFGECRSGVRNAAG